MKIVIALILIISVILLFETFLTRSRISIGVKLAEEAIAFERPQGEMNILVIGDSTAVGTGASGAKTSLAGLIGEIFPEASIKNLGVNGAKTGELIERLEKDTDSYEFISIHIGGNDIVRFTNLAELERDIKIVLDLAKTKSKSVTLTTTGNMATARLLPFGTRWSFEKRTRQVRDIFKKAAEEKGVIYNDLFREKDLDPFAQDPIKYYAADLFHPSDDGYADWFTIIEPGIRKSIDF